jgi:hypothetical protein
MGLNEIISGLLILAGIGAFLVSTIAVLVDQPRV